MPDLTTTAGAVSGPRAFASHVAGHPSMVELLTWEPLPDGRHLPLFGTEP